MVAKSIKDETNTLASPLNLTNMYVPMYHEGGTPEDARARLSEIFRSPTRIDILGGSVATSVSPLSITATWSTTSTYEGVLKVNVTDSGGAAAASKLLDLQIGGSSKLSVDKTSKITGDSANPTLSLTNSGGASLAFSTNAFTARSTGLQGVIAGSVVTMTTLTESKLGPSVLLGWTNSDASGTVDLALNRDTSDILAQRRGSNGNTLKVYRTYTSSSTFERGTFGWHDSSSDTGTVGNTLRIGTEKGSVGGTARGISLITDGVARLSFDGTGDGTLAAHLRPSAASTYQIGGSGLPYANVFANKVTFGAANMVALEHQSDLLRLTNNSTGPGVFAIDNVQGANYERLKLDWSSNVARIGTEKAGSGTARDFAIITDNAVRVTYGASGGETKAEGHNVTLGTTTGTKIGTATGEKLGFWNATPVVQQVLATGAGATVDDVITLLQTLGLCKQS